jgi:hypothetical protein
MEESKIHTFNINDAEILGLTEAIILSQMQYFVDGLSFECLLMRIENRCPYLSKYKIIKALEKLKKSGRLN